MNRAELRGGVVSLLAYIAKHSQTHPEHTQSHSRSKNNKCGLILSKKKVDKRCENGSAERISPRSQLSVISLQPERSNQLSCLLRAHRCVCEEVRGLVNLDQSAGA